MRENPPVPHRPVARCLALLIALATVPGPVAAGPARAQPAAADPDERLCAAAADLAAVATGVPRGVLQAVMLAESGRRGAASGSGWPWAVNQGGAGAYHPDRRSALAAVNAALASGVRNIDLGCFQLNWRWHGSAFDGPDAMLDPVRNAAHAARFLRALHAEFGDWQAAIGAYHSRDPDRAARYAGRVAALMAAAPAAPAAEPPPPQRQRQRGPGFPLLQGTARGPSLFAGGGDVQPLVAPARAPLLREG